MIVAGHPDGKTFYSAGALVVPRNLLPVFVTCARNSIAVILFASLMYTAELEDAYFHEGVGKWYRENNSRYKAGLWLSH